MPKTTAEIRRSFLKFFEENGHAILPSGPLVPKADPSLMFSNAGMVQFKNVFTGATPRKHERAATVQKCIRISGKHNDLENVGRTSRHHTFFEMLGNFSFGDYFKAGACSFGWKYLTEVLGLDRDRLWISIFEGDDNAPADEEALGIWRDELKVPADRILRGSAKDNFWAMGETGPCGPCSEIMYDRGETFGEASLENGERFFELWNLVFMQYQVDEPGGPMRPLPAPCIDTGAGLERIASVLQGVDSNYDIDLFAPLIEKAASLAGKRYGDDKTDDVSMRVIADHSRMAAHLISEGIFPEKTGREYVLRRVMRRAIRHAHRLGIEDPFFDQTAAAVVEVMGDAYPELVERSELISRVCSQEEERFRATLTRGLDLIASNDVWLEGEDGGKILPGSLAFDLSATYGFPLDLLSVIGEEEEFSVDEAGFAEEQEKHRLASGAGKIGEAAVAPVYAELDASLDDTSFLGYGETEAKAQILAIIRDGETVVAGREGQTVELVLDKTPFYAESGGQVGDAGTIRGTAGEMTVEDTTKPLSTLWIHRGVVATGSVRVGDTVTARVDASRRRAISRHHTATHLLHAALRSRLGTHATQKGSRVGPDLLRFDFTHFEPLSVEQIVEIEVAVTEMIMTNAPVETRITTYDEARAGGATAIFEETYGETVRMVSVGDESLELCGGIHVDRSGDIGPFFILSDSGIAAGVRRIEAVAGRAALEWAMNQRGILMKAAATLKSNPEGLPDKIEKLIGRERELVRTVEDLKRKLAAGGSSDAGDRIREISGVKVLGTKVEVGDPGTLRDTADTWKQKLGSGVVCLVGENKGKAAIVVGVTADLTDRLKASQLIREVSVLVGGKGGGRPDMAQAGGPDISRLDEAAESIYDAVSRALV